LIDICEEGQAQLLNYSDLQFRDVSIVYGKIYLKLRVEQGLIVYSEKLEPVRHIDISVNRSIKNLICVG
jgi:hypothetical protein